MRFYHILFFLLICFSNSLVQAQDAKPVEQAINYPQALPLSLEQEEEALILERHQARLFKKEQEIQREIVQLGKDQHEAEERLFYLHNQQVQTEGVQNIHSQELQRLIGKRSILLEQVADLLMEDELLAAADEDWDKVSIMHAHEIKALNEQIRALDTKIMVYEMAIPQEIEEIEDLQEKIEDTQELSDQLILLKESNQSIIEKLND